MNKHKVIIADDEMLIRKLIRMKLDALSLDLDIVGEYGDAKSAMEGVDTLAPDIILSDICMPGEDGISFSEMCINKRPELKIIIITGFNDFDYARRSLKAGVFDYLMKPVKDDELRDSLLRAMEAIEEEKAKRDKQKSLQSEIDNNIPELRKVYFSKLLFKDADTDIFVEKLKELGVSGEDGAGNGLRLGIIAIRESIDNLTLPIEIEDEVELFFKSEQMVYVFRDNWGRIVVASTVADFPMEQCLELLVEMLGKKFDCHIMSASSDIYGSLADMNQAYENALLALSDYYAENPGRSKDEMSKSVYSGIWDKIISDLSKGDAVSARVTGMNILSGIEPDAAITNVYHRLLLAIRKLCKDAKIIDAGIEKENPIENYHNLEELSWWLNERLTKLFVARDGDDQLMLIRTAYEYIIEHIDNEELNQNSLANEIGVSSSHFSRLIKQYIGKTYGEIVSELRLARMIDLLNNTSLKDRDIGIRIGIQDAHYLSIWFRKMTGYSVSEYRKMIE